MIRLVNIGKINSPKRDVVERSKTVFLDFDSRFTYIGYFKDSL